MKNKMEDLRDHLFAALEALADKDNPMPIERAKAICDVGQTLINSAKVEVDFLKIAAERDDIRRIQSGFIQSRPELTALPGQKSGK